MKLLKTLLVISILVVFACKNEKSHDQSQIEEQSQTDKVVNVFDEVFNKNKYDLIEKEMTIQDLEGLDSSQLKQLRNLFFARKGHIFESEELSVFFKRFKWYNPNKKIEITQLNKIEQKNVKLIQEIEQTIVTNNQKISKDPLCFSKEELHSKVTYNLIENAKYISIKDKAKILSDINSYHKIESYEIMTSRYGSKDEENIKILNDYFDNNVFFVDFDNDSIDELVIYSHPNSLAKLEILISINNKYHNLIEYQGGYSEIFLNYLEKDRSYIIIKDSQDGGGLTSTVNIYKYQGSESEIIEKRHYHQDTIFPETFNDYTKSIINRDSTLFAANDNNSLPEDQKIEYEFVKVSRGAICFNLSSDSKTGQKSDCSFILIQNSKLVQSSQFGDFDIISYFYGWIDSRNLESID
ncbi:MAG: YARHG domain-containing protein [Spirochaetes bacterium]|nr:YARHG domain-containing protein [Spirochaetota bacterium]MBN2771335.1 YARHG domain-containing protein [Spirochaetota bacterium]